MTKFELKGWHVGIGAIVLVVIGILFAQCSGTEAQVVPRAEDCMDECHRWCEWPLSCIVEDVELYRCSKHPSGLCCAINCCFDPLGLGCS